MTRTCSRTEPGTFHVQGRCEIVDYKITVLISEEHFVVRNKGCSIISKVDQLVNTQFSPLAEGD